MAKLTLYHLNRDTERIGVCKAQGPGSCPFSSDDPHFSTKEATQAYYENELEATYGLFGSKDETLSMDAESVTKRLNLLPPEHLKQLIWERFRFGGYTPKEADHQVAKGLPFHVSYGSSSRELTLDADSVQSQNTFMRGACADFAAQVHRATGWPMVVFTMDPKSEFWQGHVAVKTPNGEYLDISGVSKDPTEPFGAEAKSWTVSEAVNPDELHEQTANRFGGKIAEKTKLDLLERFVTAKLAFDVLESEGFIED